VQVKEKVECKSRDGIKEETNERRKIERKKMREDE
jgi:hypothetical protein